MKPFLWAPMPLEGIKRLARSIQDENGSGPKASLDAAARWAGYENFAHAKSRLDVPREKGDGRGSRSPMNGARPLSQYGPVVCTVLEMHNVI